MKGLAERSKDCRAAYSTGKAGSRASLLSLPVPCYGASSCGRTLVPRLPSPNRSSGKRSLVQTSTSAVKGWRLCMGNRFCNPLELSLRAGGHLQLHTQQSQFGGEDGTVVCAQECRLQIEQHNTYVRGKRSRRRSDRGKVRNCKASDSGLIHQSTVQCSPRYFHDSREQ